MKSIIVTTVLFWGLVLLFPASVMLSAQTVIGGSSPDPSAMLDVQSNSKGVLLPRLTTTQRTAIASPATGLMIFNTTTRCLEINMGIPTSPSWQTIKCPSCGAYVAAGVWKEFLCHNLGANTAADPFTPSWELNGDYYQWGSSTKAADGPSDANTPNNAGPAGWSSTAPSTSWSDSGLENNPCPSGFRVPSKDQWEGVLNNNTISDSPGAPWILGNNNYASGKKLGPFLYLPAAGDRDFNTGALLGRGDRAFYWSSTVENSEPDSAWYLYFNYGDPITNYNYRSRGFSVRCVKE